jgi:hypothetical protein
VAKSLGASVKFEDDDAVAIAFWNSLCEEHGGFGHALAHEAGHAVIAVHMGIEFADVSINWNPREHPSDLGIAGGGVRFASSEQLREVVVSDPAGSLRMFLAGSLAEVAAFGHTLRATYRGDLNLWRNYMGLLDCQDEASLEAALGEPFANVVRSAKQVLNHRRGALESVYRELKAAADWSLSCAEVRQVVTEGDE